MGVIPRLRTAREEIPSAARHTSRPSASAGDDRCRTRDVAVAASGSPRGSLAQASPYPSFHRRFCEPPGEACGRGGRRPAFGRGRCGAHGDDRRRGLSGRSLLEQRLARQRGRMRPCSAVGACGAITPIQLRLGSKLPSLRTLSLSRGKRQSLRSVVLNVDTPQGWAQANTSPIPDPSGKREGRTTCCRKDSLPFQIVKGKINLFR
jgi:hypothetical protein